MKKILVIFLCLAMILSFAACGDSSPAPANNNTPANNQPANTDSNTPASSSSADAGKEIAELEKKYNGLSKDDLKWEYNSSTRTIVVSGEGPMKDYGEEEPEWFKYCDEAENLIIGDKVSSVSAGAFLWFETLVNVQLGESVEFIGDSAFDDCQCLWTVNFPKSLKYIGTYAFNDDILHSDNGFALPEGLLYLGDGSFRSALKENFVYIPASLTHIGTNSFANCFLDGFSVDPANPAYASDNDILYDKGITTLINYPARKTDKLYEIPESVKTILAEAIEVTYGLEKIVIPAATETIEEGSIFWNYDLTYIDVDENNRNYKTEDGVLYTKDGKLLVAYPIACDREEYTVSEGCERLAGYSLSQAEALKELHVPEGVKEIGERALYNSLELEQAGLPKSLKSIEYSAFEFCDALTKINFAGSSKDWNSVEIGEDNELLSDGSVTVYCAE